jgi:outer membrane lipoprotein carrier protein
MIGAKVRRSAVIAHQPLLAVAILLGLAGAAHAESTSCGAEVAARVQRRYDAVRDLRGRFEQRTERATLGNAPVEALDASGEVVFAKPGKMRWSYAAPEPSLVVSDGAVLWIYDEKAREVQKLELAQGYLSAVGVQFLLGTGKLADEFEVTAHDCDAAVVTLGLRPRQDAAYESLELRVDRETAVVRETTVVDLFGNRTRVAFSELRENSGPDASLFRFDPPAGVRVIEMPAAP